MCGCRLKRLRTLSLSKSSELERQLKDRRRLCFTGELATAPQQVPTACSARAFPGGTESTARLANADTHHYTNSCPQVHSFNDMTWGDLKDWILSQERSRDSKGSVFTGPIFQESDPSYEQVKVPVEFYKVIVVVDDAKGQLSVTAFQMDQSSVMPLRPGAAGPKAPFDPGLFSVDQITLSDLEERSGLDFGRLKNFDVLAAQPVPKSLLKGAPAASAIDGRPGGRAVGSLTLSLIYLLPGFAFAFSRHEALLL
jgi:DNA/RNA non-specific endonuclease